MSQQLKNDYTLNEAFTIDPTSREFKDLRGVCEPGNPWRCLIATVGAMELGRRMTVRLNHERGDGVIGITVGDYRFERPMTAEEVTFATKFDLERRMRKPLTVKVDLGDGTWTAKPKQVRSGGGKTAANNYGAGNRRDRTIRARQLATIRKAHAGRAAAAQEN